MSEQRKMQVEVDFKHRHDGVESLGRNGEAHTHGIAINDLFGDCYTLLPVRKNGEFQRCYICIPKADFWTMVERMEALGQRPASTQEVA